MGCTSVRGRGDRGVNGGSGSDLAAVGGDVQPVDVAHHRDLPRRLQPRVLVALPQPHAPAGIGAYGPGVVAAL